MHNPTKLCCPICINISILGHIVPAAPAVSVCQARFLVAAELCSNYAAASGCGTQTASVPLGLRLARMPREGSGPARLSPSRAASAPVSGCAWRSVPRQGAVLGLPRRGSQRREQRLLWRSPLCPAPCGALGSLLGRAGAAPPGQAVAEVPEHGTSPLGIRAAGDEVSTACHSALPCWEGRWWLC